MCIYFTGAEVAVLCITKSGEVVNYQAFTNSKGVYTVAETMPESERWDACLARPISSFHTSCNHLNQANNGIKFSYKRPSGYFHAVKPFVYRHQYAPSYCWFKRAFYTLIMLCKLVVIIEILNSLDIFVCMMSILEQLFRLYDYTRVGMLYAQVVCLDWHLFFAPTGSAILICEPLFLCDF